jgi:hypothetical protein
MEALAEKLATTAGEHVVRAVVGGAALAGSAYTALAVVQFNETAVCEPPPSAPLGGSSLPPSLRTERCVVDVLGYEATSPEQLAGVLVMATFVVCGLLYLAAWALRRQAAAPG